MLCATLRQEIHRPARLALARWRSGGFLSFLIVDNPWSAFAGRDVLGFPKLLGKFTPFSSTSPFTSVTTEVFRDLFRGEKATVEPVVRIEPAPKGAKAIKAPVQKWPWGAIEDDLIRATEQALRGPLVFTPAIFECVQMKQFRDAMLPFNACYQAILQSFTFIEASGDLMDLPPARVTLNDYGSINLAERLGLPTGQPLTPISQYHIDCSFSFGEVITLFTNRSKSFWCL
jgi:hypothetical protein